jgi:hypothetical protein
VARHHRARAAAAALVLLCLTSVGLTGCSTEHLQFKNDHRLSFSTPKERDKVAAPVTIAWTMRDFEATGLDGSTDKDRGVFAVFVDRAPMPAGKNLKWLFRNDSGCKHDARCPSLQQLSDRGVLITTKTKVTIEVLPQVGDGVGDEQHFVNVVLLDGTGQRHGESAWYLPFRSKRRSV